MAYLCEITETSGKKATLNKKLEDFRLLIQRIQMNQCDRFYATTQPLRYNSQNSLVSRSIIKICEVNSDNIILDTL